jgi:recombination associated protein RdgC
MFTQATIFKLAEGSELPSTDQMIEKLEGAKFVPIGPTQDRSIGFIPPRADYGAMVEVVNRQRIMTVAIETKSVPSSVIEDKLTEACEQIEQQTGRKPGKQERRNLRDDLVLALLPAAFPKRANVQVWINPAKRLVIIGSAAQTKVDIVAMALVQTLGLALQMLNTTSSPQSAMTAWLLAESPDDWPDNLNIERECVLKSIGEEASTVRFTRHSLANDDVRKHVQEGKLPTALALSWDGRISFVLTESMQLKKLQFLDGVMSDTDEYDDRFDADVALTTGTLDLLIDDLIYALGGEFIADTQSSTN